MKLGKTRIKELFYPAFVLKWLIVKAIIISAFIAFVQMYIVNILKDITNLIEKNDFFNLQRFGYGLIVIIVLFYIFSWLIRRFDAEIFGEPRKIIYKSVIEKFVRLDNNITETTGTGKFISILQTGIRTWADMFQFIFRGGVEALTKIIFGFYFIYVILPEYFLYFFATFLFLALMVYLGNKGAIRWRKLRREAKNRQIHQLVRIIMSKFEILQNGKSAKEIQSLQNFSEEENQMNMKVYDWLWIMFLLPKAFIDFFRILVIFVVGIGVIKEVFSIGDFVAISGIIILLERSINSLTDFYKDFTKNFVDIEKLFDVLENIPEIKGYDTGDDFIYRKGDISLKNISFSYGNEKIFENFSLDIAGGRKTALVGVSGSGKTTLAKLISGYLYPNDGEIRIDNQNLENVSLKSYYRHIGYLTQEPGVLDSSILDNLTYGIDREVSEEEIKISLDLAECDFVDGFEKGLDTEIGERGIRLSGGQKQRLAIAKLFLKNPEIIILDEPTSALDSFSEEKITKAFHNLFENRTVIIIAHRLQTVKEADDIIVLQDSKIIERGNHESLVKKRGIYSRMLDLQGGVIRE